MVSRVKSVIEDKGFTPSRFADHIGVPRSTISHILSGRNKPSLEVIQKILDTFPDIKADWLVQGKGNYLKKTQDLFSGVDFEKEKPGKHELPKPKEKNIQEVLMEDIENRSMEKKKDVYTAKSSENKQDKLVESAKNGKQSEKVIVIYTDGTYSEYFPM